jgi:hypothetical protein
MIPRERLMSHLLEPDTSRFRRNSCALIHPVFDCATGGWSRVAHSQPVATRQPRLTRLRATLLSRLILPRSMSDQKASRVLSHEESASMTVAEAAVHEYH